MCVTYEVIRRTLPLHGHNFNILCICMTEGKNLSCFPFFCIIRKQENTALILYEHIQYTILYYHVYIYTHVNVKNT